MWYCRLAGDFAERRTLRRTHAKKFGFDVVLVQKEYNTEGLRIEELSPRFRTLSVEDLQTRGAMVVLQKRVDG